VSDFASNSHGVRAGEKYGIEVEAEGCPYEQANELNWSDQFGLYWGMTHDGSLRNGGIEFVSRPLARTHVPPAIDSLWRYFAEGRMVPSVRTGIHIHANCIGLDTDQVTRILMHYALVEPQLFSYVGPEREENIYCIPWYRGLDEPAAIREWLAGDRNARLARGARAEPCKYSALYVGPLSRFGTIEFRHAPTWTDSRTMLQWWKMVQMIWRTGTTKYDVLEKWREMGAAEFTRKILPFDWLVPVPDSAYEDADVEAVASLLAPQAEPPSFTWGRAPELRIVPTEEAPPPTVTIPQVRIRRAEPTPQTLESYLAGRSQVEVAPSPAELTVNVAAWAPNRRPRYALDAPADEYITASDYDEESDEDDDEWREPPEPEDYEPEEPEPEAREV
jgi:hypothetical protein